MKSFFSAVGKKVLQAEHFVVVVSCLAMVTLVFITVIMRYIFKTSFQGMEDLIMCFAFVIYFIGGALSTRDESQITADCMSLFIKNPKTMTLIKSLQNIVDAVLIGICAVFATQYTMFVIREGSKTSGLKMPLWIVYSIIMIGFILMTFYAFYHFVEYLRKFIHYDDEKEEVQS